jgi:hypothetical protein
MTIRVTIKNNSTAKLPQLIVTTIDANAHGDAVLAPGQEADFVVSEASSLRLFQRGADVSDEQRIADLQAQIDAIKGGGQPADEAAE